MKVIRGGGVPEDWTCENHLSMNTTTTTTTTTTTSSNNNNNSRSLSSLKAEKYHY